MRERSEERAAGRAEERAAERAAERRAERAEERTAERAAGHAAERAEEHEVKSAMTLDELLSFADSYSDRMEEVLREEREKNERPERELVLWTAIAGISHHLDPDSRKGKRIMKKLTPGTPLKLLREPKNRYDPWAVRVETAEGQTLGYITRFKNETVARMMDHGHRFEAQVEQMSGRESEKMRAHRAATEQFILPFSVWLVN